MLSRLAESFYWLGRYVERAEATGRLLAEHHQLLVEDPHVPDDLACRALLEALTVQPDPYPSSPAGLVQAMVGDRSNPSTLAGSVARAHDNARGVRDAVSAELYEALNTANLALRPGAVPPANPGPALYAVLGCLDTIAGIVGWTMPRDEAALFLFLGRSLERIDMTARLLDVRHDLLWPASGPVAALRAAGALHAFLRSGATPTGVEVRRFLVLDAMFPRSMRRCAADAEESVRGLERYGARGADGALRRTVGMLRSQLDYADEHEVDQLAADAQAAAAEADLIVAQTFFHQAGTVVWSH